MACLYNLVGMAPAPLPSSRHRPSPVVQVSKLIPLFIASFHLPCTWGPGATMTWAFSSAFLLSSRQWRRLLRRELTWRTATPRLLTRCQCHQRSLSLVRPYTATLPFPTRRWRPQRSLSGQTQCKPRALVGRSLRLRVNLRGTSMTRLRPLRRRLQRFPSLAHLPKAYTTVHGARKTSMQPCKR
jgi:hypothetical protein